RAGASGAAVNLANAWRQFKWSDLIEPAPKPAPVLPPASVPPAAVPPPLVASAPPKPAAGEPSGKGFFGFPQSRRPSPRSGESGKQPVERPEDEGVPPPPPGGDGGSEAGSVPSPAPTPPPPPSNEQGNAGGNDQGGGAGQSPNNGGGTIWVTLPEGGGYA